MTPEQADKITIEEVEKIDSVQAAAIYSDSQYWPASNKLNPAEFIMPELGTWRMSDRGEFEILVKIRPGDMVAGEKDWNYALRLESTQCYIIWQKDGKLPPPVSVVRNYSGQLVCLNRRRWLAAIEAKTEFLYCWYSPSHETKSTSKWYLPERAKFWQLELTRLYTKYSLQEIVDTFTIDRWMIKRFIDNPEFIPSEIDKVQLISDYRRIDNV